jgi:hypothetical protein
MDALLTVKHSIVRMVVNRDSTAAGSHAPAQLSSVASTQGSFTDQDHTASNHCNLIKMKHSENQLTASSMMETRGRNNKLPEIKVRKSWFEDLG